METCFFIGSLNLAIVVTQDMISQLTSRCEELIGENKKLHHDLTRQSELLVCQPMKSGDVSTNEMRASQIASNRIAGEKLYAGHEGVAYSAPPETDQVQPIKHNIHNNE